MLDEKLVSYNESNNYPFHMPGHKRNMKGIENAYAIDITEIDGFDNLHEPEGLILEAMERLQRLYQSKRSYLLVNGSTCGNMAAIFAATKQGGSIIIGRNCHKSVYHAVELRQLKVSYTYPEVNKQGIVTGTDLKEYKRAMEKCPEAEAIVVTSPSYEGHVEPLDEIVKMAHSYGMKVIVDAAHGAHLGFHPSFPESPLASGADLVIMSLHKTLPALTQTAVLHINVENDKLTTSVEKYLRMFMTSSPSYVLMASICQCIRFLEQGKQDFECYVQRLNDFYSDCDKLRCIRVEKASDRDVSKIVIDVSKTNISGYELMALLREEYKMELEMASFYYGLAMSSVMDTKEGFDRLRDALFAIDSTCKERKREIFDVSGFFAPGEKVIEIYQAAEQETRQISIEDAAGHIAGGMVSIYPPAIPLLVPGERITMAKLELLQEAMNQKLHISGLAADAQIVVI